MTEAKRKHEHKEKAIFCLSWRVEKVNVCVIIVKAGSLYIYVKCAIH